MKALKAFRKPFEVPQKSVKIKVVVDFYFNTTFWNTRGRCDALRDLVPWSKSNNSCNWKQHFSIGFFHVWYQITQSISDKILKSNDLKGFSTDERLQYLHRDFLLENQMCIQSTVKYLIWSFFREKLHII